MHLWGAVFQPFSACHCCVCTPLRLCTQSPPEFPQIVFIPFDCRGAANAGSKQTVCLISAVSSCLSSCDRWWPGQQRGLAKHRGWRWPGKREETQQKERDLSEGGHQHHEGMALPAPNGELKESAVGLSCSQFHITCAHWQQPRLFFCLFWPQRV